MTFWERASNFPPVLVRLLAHQRGKPLTTEQIAAKAGMTTLMVEALSQSTDWQGVSPSEMQRFTSACGMDFCDPKAMRRVDDYLRKKPTFLYLRASPEWASYYEPLLKLWRRSYPGPLPVHLCKPVQDLIVRLTPVL